MNNIEEILHNYQLDKCNYIELPFQLRSFDMQNNYIFFFDLLNQRKLNSSVESNYDGFNKMFTGSEKEFIYLPRIEVPSGLPEIYKYFIPHLSIETSKGFQLSNLANEMLIAPVNNRFGSPTYSDIYKQILESLDYSGDITSGYLFFVGRVFYVVSYDEVDLTNNKKNPLYLIQDYFLDFDDGVFESRHKVNSLQKEKFKKSLQENLNEESSDKVNEIRQKLKELKNSGQILFALPILKDILNEYSSEIDTSSLSDIEITKNNKILLPEFDNMEIKLSHLTKTVYILFCNYPKGINIKQLEEYKNELREIYLSISNQIDYDAMMASINDLVSSESKAIYTHISRIKSTFFGVMDAPYAQNYIITSDGFGEDIKYISILRPIEDKLDVMDFL